VRASDIKPTIVKSAMIPAALFTEIKVANVTVDYGSRLRRLQPDVVDAFMESIKIGSSLPPITVATKPGGGYQLVAGLHRLKAVRKLGHTTISAAVIRGANADQMLLTEIDENLLRAELSPAERAGHIHRRKEIYERLYPQAKHGGDRKSERSRSQDCELESLSPIPQRKLTSIAPRLPVTPSAAKISPA